MGEVEYFIHRARLRGTAFIQYKGNNIFWQSCHQLCPERENVWHLNHSGSISLQFVVVTHNAFPGVIFDVPELVVSVVGCVIINEPVV
jgi:hypothetical protein